MASPIPLQVQQGSKTVPIGLAVAALALAHLFDYASFLVMVGRHGIGAEANPIVVMLTEEGGLPWLTLAKVATVTFAALLMIVMASRNRRMAMALLLFGVIAGVVGGLSNVAAL